MSPRVLLVEPNAGIADNLLDAARVITKVDYQVNFESARRQLTETAFDFVFTNLRLGEFNGLHLVHLGAEFDQPPRCIVYTDKIDLLLGREVQRAGAFYETAPCLPVTLGAYLRGRLPTTDRRDPTRLDRRLEFRGGRRCWDEYMLRAGTTA
jgi:DNA-binding NtrC family response regulator